MIKLIVGLGNPGKEYETHRHNAGFWLANLLADRLDFKFIKQTKFYGEAADTLIGTTKVWILKPQTFMNHSGKSVQALATYFDIKTNEILVVHDELDLNPGTAKIKFGGGHGGHNGLRDIINALSSQEFYRLRIGIGHPGTKNEVVNFVLHPPSQQELDLIGSGIDDAIGIINLLANDQIEDAMKSLHTN